jgi:O-acetyl-ADP-ribose deacetylase (regulator of RNase III)
MQEILSNIKRILNAIDNISIEKLSLVAGIIFLLLSFFQFNQNNQKVISLDCPNYIKLSIGIIFILLFLVQHCFFRHQHSTKQKITTNGKIFRYNNINITLKLGKIEDNKNYSRNSIILLPANTKFDDDCITDNKSALGAFFIEYYPNQLKEAKEAMVLQAQNNCKTIGTDEFELGSIIILPPPFDKVSKVAISAITKRQPQKGITANLSTISLCIRNIFEITSDKKIDTIILPALGSGHGGLELKYSINSILFHLKYYSQLYHHIKQVFIMIYSNDMKPIKINTIDWRNL